MRRIIQDFVNFQINRLHGYEGEDLLTERVLTRISDALYELAETIACSTVTGYISDELLLENPYAAIAPDLISRDQRESALKTIRLKMESGTLSLPATLVDILNLRLSNVTDAIIEMSGRVKSHRKGICETLLDGRSYTKLEDIILSAGDTHNHGRNVMILTTDAGKIVYKPHDCRGDAGIYELAARFFSDALGIPRCYAVEEQFGVCEFIEKQRSEGAEDAKAFWHNMGGASAVMKMLGSTDMHIENITCRGNKPYILDLETIVSPGNENRAYRKLHPELEVLKSSSPYLVGLLPSELTGRQLSVLLNTDEDGCAPVVGGKKVSVAGYMSDFFEGYDKIYHRILVHKDDILQMLRSFVPDMPVRVLIRHTQRYHDVMKKLYHRNAVASTQQWDSTRERLNHILSKNLHSDFMNAVESELCQLERGDIPYIYTYGCSRKLWSEGEPVTDEIFETTAEEHTLNTIAAMSESDMRFDLTLLKRSILQYPRLLADAENLTLPVRSADVISGEQALSEAGRMFDKVDELKIAAPDGSLFWGYIFESDYSFRFCGAGLTNGLTGIAVFVAAYAKVTGWDRAKELSDRVESEMVAMLNRMYEFLAESQFAWERAPYLGESEGIGGILIGLALLKRYTGRSDVQMLQEKTLFMLKQFDLSRYGAPDRMIGIAGLLSALCRFEEYRTHTDLIKEAADSLLAMKKLDYKGKALWKPFPDKARPISGGGHGLAGIAESLYAASATLNESGYADAAADAIEFEMEAYNDKFGSWSDLRSYPPIGYMHGYCSGAPGIGIMLERIRRNGFTGGALKKCEELAAQSIAKLPLNERDHLCCGNSSIAEYYMSAGDYEAAGQILNSIRVNCEKTGNYRYISHKFYNGETASLFYGVSGVGYEMLRYAYPDQIISIL